MTPKIPQTRVFNYYLHSISNVSLAFNLSEFLTTEIMAYGRHKDHSEVSKSVKYLLFFFNVFFWVSFTLLLKIKLLLKIFKVE